MTAAATLLPPNATALELGLEAAGARISSIPIPLPDLWNPWTCPVELLPWLAWGLSVDRWRPDWTDDRKRGEVASAIELQRRKGTPASVDAVLASFSDLLELVEWHEMLPRGEPHTFEVRYPLRPGASPPSPDLIAEVVREVTRTKPARSHFDMLLRMAASAGIYVAAGAQVTRFERFDATAYTDASASWAAYLQTEAGEPLQDVDGSFLRDS